MNVVGHQVRKCLVNHSMPLQQVPAREGLRLDPHGKVPGAGPRARMACVAGAVVPHRDLCRREGRFQSSAYPGGPWLVHAGQSARMASSGACAAIQNPWTMTNTNVSPSMPNSLKFTQVASSK